MFHRFRMYYAYLAQKFGAEGRSLQFTFGILMYVKLGLLNQPNLLLIQLIALIVVFVNNVIYLFVVHIVALLLLDRIGNSIPRPPKLVKILLDYD